MLKAVAAAVEVVVLLGQMVVLLPLSTVRRVEHTAAAEGQVAHLLTRTL